jgi:hypothetical protein
MCAVGASTDCSSASKGTSENYANLHRAAIRATFNAVGAAKALTNGQRHFDGSFRLPERDTDPNSQMENSAGATFSIMLNSSKRSKCVRLRQGSGVTPRPST